jgi:acyl-CoA synthetase (AMP-forming)/AMP-acid ligase II
MLLLEDVYLSFLLSIRLVLGNLAAWVHGSCILYSSPIYSPPAIVEALLRPHAPDEACTALHGVPTHLIGVLQALEKTGEALTTVQRRALRTGIASGSPVPMELMKKLQEKMGLEELTIAYGMSESKFEVDAAPHSELIDFCVRSGNEVND